MLTATYHNDGKNKYQSQELKIEGVFSEFGMVYGDLKINIHGGDIQEVNEIRDLFIDLLILNLQKLRGSKLK